MVYFKFTFAEDVPVSEFKKKEIKWYETWMMYVKSAEARVIFHGNSEPDFLEFLGRFSMSRIMQFGIVKKDPSFADKFMKAAQEMGNVTMQPEEVGFLLSESYYDAVRKGWISPALVNKKGTRGKKF